MGRIPMYSKILIGQNWESSPDGDIDFELHDLEGRARLQIDSTAEEEGYE